MSSLTLATRTALRTAGIMLVFTVVFTSLMAGMFWLTRMRPLAMTSGAVLNRESSGVPNA